MVKCDGAANFIAVDQSASHGGRTRACALQDRHIRNISVAEFILRNIGNIDQFIRSGFRV